MTTTNAPRKRKPGGGRKRDYTVERCPCQCMTAKRAKARAHHCQPVAPVYNVYMKTNSMQTENNTVFIAPAPKTGA